jgi:ankyrin repeat protein
MRLDRRSAVINRRGVVPGSAENSFLFHRISSADYGIQMPPTGALKPEQIDTIKRWIEQGAEWPDALANETELPPIDPKAVAMVDALHEGDLAKFMKFAAEDAKLLNARGPEGSTPFMYAVLYTNAAMLERLLKLGADPNRRNDANATALMWAATEMDKTKVLLSHGADVNARSSDMRTPAMIAARKLGNSAVVKLLLDNGANPNPNPHPSAESSPLVDAASAGDADSVEMLIAKGAEVKPVGETAIFMAATAACSKCLSLLTAREIDKNDYSLALADIAITGDVNAVKMMLDHGADVNIVDPLGRTPLM